MWSDYFYYDETSPSYLRWKVDRCTGKNFKVIKVRAGDVAGTLGVNGRWRIKFNKKSFLIHRVIWEIFNGDVEKGLVIDHINRDPSDNKISNLRKISKRENSFNQRKRKNNKTGWTGVAFTYYSNVLYCVATSMQKSGKAKLKCFNVELLGIMEATKRAVIARRQLLEDLRKDGMIYSKEHGK